jgi:hypothetical protein
VRLKKKKIIKKKTFFHKPFFVVQRFGHRVSIPPEQRKREKKTFFEKGNEF